MVVWIDGKNPALYSSGISSWLLNLLENLSPEEISDSVLITPNVTKVSIYPDIEMTKVKLPWFQFLSRKLNHIVYDRLTLRVSSAISKPEKIFSPYFDVVVSKRIPHVITVHDLCFIEVPNLYSRLQRIYYLSLLGRNVKNAEIIVTVSETSKKAILKHFDLPAEKMLVIPNGLNSDFTDKKPTSLEISSFRKSFGESSLLVLYTSGFENRKNLYRLLQALNILDTKGINFKFLVTGKVHSDWSRLLTKFPTIMDKTRFMGYLSDEDLKIAYSSANVVVFPSLNEGFGRACMESMSTGTPLACSNLPVFHEVAGDYANYFSPNDIEEMSIKIYEAIVSGHKEPIQPTPVSDSPGFKELRNYLFESPQLS